MSANLQCLHGCLISYSSPVWIKELNYVIASGKLRIVTHVCCMNRGGVLTGSQWQCDQRRRMSKPPFTLAQLSSHPALSVGFSARNTGG